MYKCDFFHYPGAADTASIAVAATPILPNAKGYLPGSDLGNTWSGIQLSKASVSERVPND